MAEPHLDSSAGQPAAIDPVAAPAEAAVKQERDDGEIEAIRNGVVQALQTVFDPEIPVNIYELGLIYDIEVDRCANTSIKMTLTAPGCPVAGTMPGLVQEAVSQVEGIGAVDVELVWDPPWEMSRMSEAARLELGMI